MPVISINFADAEGNQDLIDKGTYDCIVKKAELRFGKTSDQPYINLTLAILNDGEFQNRYLWAMGSLSPKALWRTKKLFEALDIDTKEIAKIEYDEATGVITYPIFVDRKVGVEVDHEEGNDGVTRAKPTEFFAVKAATVPEW